MDYNFSAIEKKWQAYWLENKTFKCVEVGLGVEFVDGRDIFH